MKELKHNTIFLLFLLISVFSRAEIVLPAIFGDNMVLQQKAEAPVWGKATPGKMVNVSTSWDKKKYSVRAENDGSWKVKVNTPSAGGPYEITISDGTVLKLKNVLIGEVWICSGQSNMQMPMKGFRNQPVAGSNEAIVKSANENIRLFTVERNRSFEPLDNLTGQWKNCIPENVAEFSATAYYFGRMLQEILDVPVGLICSSWGGTRIEPWISETGLTEFGWVKLPDKQTEEVSSGVPGALFNAMIHPMVGYSIRGVIWYQGESNKDEPKQYRELLPGLIKDWRSQWNTGDFPFYYVQIAPYDYGTDKLSSTYLREAQLKASNSLPNIGMACILDAGEKDCIHPANKKVVGDRLAYLALAQTYGKGGFSFSGPVLKDMSVEENIVHLTFDHAESGMTSYGKEITGFKVAGEDKKFYQAFVRITRSGISLSSPLVTNPVAVRYAFSNFPEAELFNVEGLPASSFRTDDW